MVIYFRKNCNRRYSCSTEKNKNLWKKLKNLSSKHSIKWVWVKGHAQDKFNNMADEFAQRAIKN